MFAAISEELGGIFALCVLLICLGTLCGLCFHCGADAGAVSRLITPQPGYGLASRCRYFYDRGRDKVHPVHRCDACPPCQLREQFHFESTFIIFGVIQGLYILKQNDEEDYEKDID